MADRSASAEIDSEHWWGDVMARMMCPHCGWTYDPSINGEGYDFVPNHWFKAVDCPGQQQHPRNAESDKRPLWRDEKISGAELICNLKQVLSSLACYAATAREVNTNEWMQELAERLNAAARVLDQPKVFVWHHSRESGELWITCEDIP